MNTPINWLDALMLLALLAAMAIGFWQGVVRQIVTLGAFYIAAVVSTRIYPNIAQILMSVASGMVPTVADVLAFFILLFVIGLVAVFLTIDTFRKLTERKPGAAARVGGGVAALVGMAVLITFVLTGIKFAALTPWPASSEGMRQILTTALDTSNLVPVIRQLDPLVIQSIRFWGGNLPPMFSSNFGV